MIDSNFQQIWLFQENVEYFSPQPAYDSILIILFRASRAKNVNAFVMPYGLVINRFRVVDKDDKFLQVSSHAWKSEATLHWF